MVLFRYDTNRLTTAIIIQIARLFKHHRHSEIIWMTLVFYDFSEKMINVCFTFFVAKIRESTTTDSNNFDTANARQTFEILVSTLHPPNFHFSTFLLVFCHYMFES